MNFDQATALVRAEFATAISRKESLVLSPNLESVTRSGPPCTSYGLREADALEVGNPSHGRATARSGG